jgi:phage pi2 protein 07
MDKDEVSELAARIVERDGLSASGESRTTEEVRRNVLNIAALGREEFEKALGLNEAGWVHYGQTIEPGWPFGGQTLREIHAVAENYRRAQPIDRADDTLEFWWISPENIGKVVRNGKEYPHPAPEVIRMLVR